MDPKLREEIAQFHAEICSGLADPNRILLLYTLVERPYNVTELAEVVNLPQPTVSRHLKVLRERGLVIPRRDGQSVFYSLADERVIEALDLLRGLLADRLAGQVSLARRANEELSSVHLPIDEP